MSGKLDLSFVAFYSNLMGAFELGVHASKPHIWGTWRFERNKAYTLLACYRTFENLLYTLG
jgi:hypothetical protein